MEAWIRAGELSHPIQTPNTKTQTPNKLQTPSSHFAPIGNVAGSHVTIHSSYQHRSHRERPAPQITAVPRKTNFNSKEAPDCKSHPKLAWSSAFVLGIVRLLSLAYPTHGTHRSVRRFI